MLENFFVNNEIICRYRINYARTNWTIVLSHKGIEVGGIKRRVFIYSQGKIIEYGMVRSFLRTYTKLKYGIDIKSNKSLPTYNLIIALKDPYEMCLLIYKFRNYL